MKYLITIITILFIQQSLYAKPPSNILEKMGINEIKTNSQININLTNLNKQENVLLSSYKTNWTFVIFWKSSVSRSIRELVLVDQVAKQLAFAGVKIINISLDTDIDKAKSAISNLDLNYPSFYTNDVAHKLYSSQIIPSVYLLSPDWKYVGKANRLIGWMYGDLIKQMLKVIKQYKK